MKPKIKIITGSTRPGRFNIQPADWIYELGKKRDDVEVELVDLEKINLPFLDEAVPPSHHKYEKEHTKKWAKIIEEADGFIFVTPEYNHSYSAVLKNAIDFLFLEWNYKPLGYVGYGSVGGARAVEHLRGIAGELKMFDIRESVLIPKYWEHTDENGMYLFNEVDQKAAESMYHVLAFWAKVMKEGREEFNKAS